MTVPAISCRILYKNFIWRRCCRYGKFIDARPKLKAILKKALRQIGSPPKASPTLGGHRAATADPRQYYLGYLATAARIISNRFA